MQFKLINEKFNVDSTNRVVTYNVDCIFEGMEAFSLNVMFNTAVDYRSPNKCFCSHGVTRRFHSKGIAKCNKNDKFDINTGRLIAKRKALIKLYNKIDNALSNNIDYIKESIDLINERISNKINKAILNETIVGDSINNIIHVN